jgi:hypothetical protein
MSPCFPSRLSLMHSIVLSSLIVRLEEDGVISECDIGVLALQEPTSDFQFKKAPAAGRMVIKVSSDQAHLLTYFQSTVFNLQQQQ